MSSCDIPISKALSLLLPASVMLPYDSALTRSEPSPSIEPELRILRDNTTIVVVKTAKINTETYQGTMLNKPLLPSAGDDVV